MGVSVPDYLIVVASRPKFSEPLRQALEGLGARLCEVESWKEARDLLEDDDDAVSLAIIDAELVLDPSSTARPRLDAGAGWPAFLLSQRAPSSQVVVNAYRLGFLGYLSHECPLDETVFRVRAFLENQDPRHYSTAPRVSMIGPVQLTLRDDDAARPLSGLQFNISRTGMMLRTISTPPVRTRVTVSLWLPQELEPISIHGHVVWVEGDSGRHVAGAIGIEFEESDSANQKTLLAYILRTIEDQTIN